MSIPNDDILSPPPPVTFGERLGAMLRSFAAPRPAKPPMGEVSVSDPNTFYGVAMPYNPNELISTRGYETLDRMRKDDQVKAALAFKKNSVIAAGWRIVAPDGNDAEWEPRVEVERNLTRLEGGFQRFARELLSALDYGFSLSEKVWWEEEGRLRLKKIATRRPHDLTLETDDGGNLSGIEQNGKRLEPLEKFVLYSYDYEFGNIYGRTDLEAAYRAWWTKSNSYRWMAMLLERMGIPPVYALFDSGKYNKTQQEKLFAVLKGMQAATVATIPRPEKDSLEFWSPELAGQVSTVFRPAMEMFNQDISRALLMPGLLGMTSETKQGSFARAAVQFDVFMLVLDAIRTETQDLINKQIVNDILLYNFGEMAEEEKPYFEWMPLTDDAKDVILTQWTNLINAKVVQAQDADEAHIRETLHMPEMDEDDVAERSARRSLLAPSFEPSDEGDEEEEDGEEGEDDDRSGSSEDDEDEGEPERTAQNSQKQTKGKPTLRFLSQAQFNELMGRFAPRRGR